LTLIKEKELNMKKENNDIVLNKLKLELEELNKKYNNDELELTYYNVKETVINFFEKMTIEEKRTSSINDNIISFFILSMSSSSSNFLVKSEL
jgi:hypothetical protein